ncbi:hypothetical protein [Microbacterium invictum]|uniref:Uncharacterized protein n=1 Tax=Microbacterium invictum TaxID=515415 RepID=A0AA40VKG1_9MICO|nr:MULTISPECIES: hypothetical protein [Microbacterium]MBB4138554.1 hypothetical protein [Microbacterium invictum]
MSPNERQRIVRVAGSRRVRLTPAPGTSAEPVPGDASTMDAGADANGAAPASGISAGPNDDRLRRDVPPHY